MIHRVRLIPVFVYRPPIIAGPKAADLQLPRRRGRLQTLEALLDGVLNAWWQDTDLCSGAFPTQHPPLP